MASKCTYRVVDWIKANLINHKCAKGQEVMIYEDR